jgi:Replication-relaxation
MNSSRRPVLERVAKKDRPPFNKTLRDDEILNLIYEFDFADRWQIEKLKFPPDPSRTTQAPSAQCIRRLEGLFHDGYVDRHRYYCSITEGSYPIIYTCTPKGYAEVAGHRGVELADLDIPPKSDITTNKYPHNKRIRDFRVYAMLASQLYGIPIVTWISDRTIRKTHENDKVHIVHNGRTLSRSWEPDGIMVLQINDKVLYYPLEIDMGNQSLDTFALKIKTIIEYRQRDIYQARYKTGSQRNLIVTTGEERLANLKRVTEDAKGNNRFWFTTWDKLNEHTIFTQSIWQLASYPKEDMRPANEVR